MSSPEYVAAVNVLMGELTRALMTASEPLLGLIQHTTVDHLPNGDADPSAAVGVMHPVDMATTFTPNVAERIKNLPFTAEQIARFDSIIAGKKVKFDARRRVRQLG